MQPCPDHPSTAGPRGTTASRGYGAKWQRRRLALLAERPWCESEGCEERAVHVDHVVPRRVLVAQGVADPDAFEHLQGLCRPHHGQKTAQDRETGPHWMEIG